MSEKTLAKTGSSYEIRVRDHIDIYWSAFFDGWTIKNLENGEFVLNNDNVDLAGLHGILNKVRDLNLTLLSVNMINR